MTHRAALAALLLCGLPAGHLASVRDHARPATVPLSAADDTNTTSFDVNGLKVILRRNTSNDVVSANMYLLGGTQQLTPATQGIETLLLDASERGTKRYPGAATRESVARLGTVIDVQPSADWTLFGFTAIRSTFDSSFAVFADRLVEPTLDSGEVELVRARLVAAAASGENSPDPLVEHLADSISHVGQPYSFSVTGTPTTLESISLAQLRRYQATQMMASRMLLVVVGNVDRDRVEHLVEDAFAPLPRGNYSWSPPAAQAPPGRAVVTRTADIPTNYLLGYYTGPSARDPDYAALRVATAVLSGRFFTEIRSQRNLSYEVDAPFVDRAVSNGGVYVTTVDPNTTLRIMRAEIDQLQREPIEQEGLQRLVQEFITEYFLKNETDADQASFLARAAIYQGDYHAAGRFVDDLRRVRPEDVMRVARQYMHDFRFAYVGRPDSLSRALLDQF